MTSLVFIVNWFLVLYLFKKDKTKHFCDIVMNCIQLFQLMDNFFLGLMFECRLIFSVGWEMWKLALAKNIIYGLHYEHSEYGLI